MGNKTVKIFTDHQNLNVLALKKRKKLRKNDGGEKTIDIDDL